MAIVLCEILPMLEKEYSSKEEDEYDENWQNNFVPFEPLDTAFILEYQPKYYEIQESELNYKPYSPDNHSTPYSDSIFSIIHSLDFDMQNAFEFERIGNVYKTQILLYEKKDSIEAFIYESSEFEDIWFGESGVWIGYSENDGKDWNYYYTGIVQKQPVFVKFYSQRPLIKEKGKLEIDACLLRQLSPFSHPFPSQSYECVRDGIYFTFDIDIISKDSDGDGLTDIVEDKLFTNKFNKDTDGDGISDIFDMNPRVYFPRTKKSKIFEAILNEDIGSKYLDWTIGRLSFKGDNTASYVTDSTETVLIVTDDEDLMGIQPKEYRTIFITTDDYKSIAKAYNSELNEMSFTPFFKVDNKKNTYIVSYSFNTGGSRYLIKKTILGWRIKLLSTWIS